MIHPLRAIRRFSLAAAEAPYPVRPRPTVKPRFVLRLWLPMTLVLLLLAPFALLFAPLLYLAPRPYRDRPFATVLGVGALLLSLGGAMVDVDTPDTRVSIRIF